MKNFATIMDECRNLMRKQGMTDEQINLQIAIDRKNAISGKYMFALPMMVNQITNE